MKSNNKNSVLENILTKAKDSKDSKELIDNILTFGFKLGFGTSGAATQPFNKLVLDLSKIYGKEKIKKFVKSESSLYNELYDHYHDFLDKNPVEDNLVNFKKYFKTTKSYATWITIK